MNVVDLYEGFEGEPEIKIISKNKQGQTDAVLHLWDDYFDSIIRLIEPNEKGFWEGFPLDYHTTENYKGEENWECVEKDLFVEQLKGIDIASLSADYRKAYQELLKVFEDAIMNNHKIHFNYE
jgi:hypothetical protein